MALAEQVETLDKAKLGEKIGKITDGDMRRADGNRQL